MLLRLLLIDCLKWLSSFLVGSVIIIVILQTSSFKILLGYMALHGPLSSIVTSSFCHTFEDAYEDCWELSCFFPPLATLKSMVKWRLQAELLLSY